MDVGATLEARAQTPECVQPSMSALYNPANLIQAAAVRLATPGDGGGDAGSMKRPAIFVVVVRAISVDAARLAQRAASASSDSRNRFDQRQKLGDVVTVCAGQDDRDRRAICIGGDMVLGTWSRAIGGVRACFWPAPSARTEEESMTTREKSMRSAAHSLARRISCNRSHTPALCQSRSRRQQLTPEPQPISAASSFHRMPLLNTNKMPVSAARSDTGMRPGYRNRLGLAGGRSGSISAHNSSSMVGLPIPSALLLQRMRLTGSP